MGKRVLADKKIKLTILTTKPANEAAPTVAELNAGIEACKKVLSDGFRFSPTASGTASAKALCGSNEEAFTDSNAELAFTHWRYYLEAGGIDPADDELFQAVMTRGTTLWAYMRKTDKPAPTAWVAAEEIRIGARFTVDYLRDPSTEAYISYEVPTAVEDFWTFRAVAAGA